MTEVLIHAPDTEPVPTAIPGKKAAASNWWKIGDVAVLLVYVCITTFTLQYHEKWADEAQAWLLARDLDLKSLWFHELRYEGSPGLWHTILWVAQHIFHAPYAAIGYIGLVCATAGVAVLLFLTPFPRGIKWLMAFSFFFLYQYAVIARSYVLFACFALLIARQFRNLKRPDLFALSLVPLALLTAHGSLMSASLALVYALRFIRRWSEHDSQTRKRFFLSAGALVLLYLFLFFILFPASDTEATHDVALTASVIFQRASRAIKGALVDNAWLSFLVLGICAIWCYVRKLMGALILPVISMVALYVYADSWAHQDGTIFLAIVTGLAIAWPTSAERANFNRRDRAWYHGIVAVLGVILCYQVWIAAVVIRRDIRLPYSGAEDTARYLRPLVNLGKTIDGYQYGMVAVNAYFDHNIFANHSRAYYHHSIYEFNPVQVPQEMAASPANYIVINWWDQFDENLFRDGLLAPMATWGYSLDHVSDGYLLTKTGYSHRQIYLVFKKDSVLAKAR